MLISELTISLSPLSRFLAFVTSTIPGSNQSRARRAAGPCIFRARRAISEDTAGLSRRRYQGLSFAKLRRDGATRKREMTPSRYEGTMVLREAWIWPEGHFAYSFISIYESYPTLAPKCPRLFLNLRKLVHHRRLFIPIVETLIAMAADVKGDAQNAVVTDDPSGRRGSLVVDTALASEEDAAVLAKMGFVSLPC